MGTQPLNIPWHEVPERYDTAMVGPSTGKVYVYSMRPEFRNPSYFTHDRLELEGIDTSHVTDPFETLTKRPKP